MVKRKWIQEAGIKKGRLSKQLGIPEKKNIPRKVLDKVIKIKVGKTVNVNNKVKVTSLLKRRAVLARTLKKLKRK